MSSIYHTEPPTSGKVLLKTSYGDIDVEIWAKEAPLASRNFIQLALEGYYNGNKINRLIKGFMIQTGDPGVDGGKSIWGKPFKDELHSRIKFNHRGQLAMANENKPNSNHSQFFMTLDVCPWLDGKHTIFGKITGNTIFNLLRMGEADVDELSRPLEEIKILSVEVLLNPFDDIVPRECTITLSRDEEKKSMLVRTTAAVERKAIKNKKLLSFFDDDEDANAIPKDSKSREALIKEDGARQQLAVSAYSSSSNNSSNSSSSNNSSSSSTISSSIKNNNRTISISRTAVVTSSTAALSIAEELQKVRDELLRSKKDMQSVKSVEIAAPSTNTTKAEKQEQQHPIASIVDERRQKYLKRKVYDSGNREDSTMTKLLRFKAHLKDQKQALCPRNNEKEAYHGQVLESSDGDVVADTCWHAGKLTFKKHIDDDYRLGSDLRSVDDYVVIDMTTTATGR